MPISRTIERSSTSLPSSPQRPYTLSSHLATQHEESDTMLSKASSKRGGESPRRYHLSTQKSTPTSSLTAPQSQSSRRSGTNETLPPMRGRANTDVQSILSSSNGLKQQQLLLGGSSSDKYVNQQHHHQQSSGSVKPKCILPTTTCQPGYVTPSKLFNMMGYGLENQYLFMLAHYLYVIDCRTREKFNDSHIVTGKVSLLRSLSPRSAWFPEKTDRTCFVNLAVF